MDPNNKNNNLSAEGTPLTGAYNKQGYTDQNPTYPPPGHQPVLTGQHGLNGGPTLQDNMGQGQYGHGLNQGYGAGGGGTVGNNNIRQYGGAPPATLTHFAHGAPGPGGYTQRVGDPAIPPTLTHFAHGAPGPGGYNQRVGDPTIPPTNIITSDQHDTGCGGSSFQRTVGKLESAVGSMIGNDSLKAKGLQREHEANSVKAQGLEIAEAERLEREAMMRRERAVGHGAHPANLALGGGHVGQAAGGPLKPYN